MGDTLHKMEVKIEGDSSGFKKEMESSRQEVKRGVEAIQKETEKMKNPFRNLASSKTLSSVRASMKKIKDSFASFSLKDKTKEFQIKAGIKVPTEEYKNVISDIDKVQAKLDRYYERRDKGKDGSIAESFMVFRIISHCGSIVLCCNESGIRL